jgi:hypothetical protein
VVASGGVDGCVVDVGDKGVADDVEEIEDAVCTVGDVGT